MNNLHLGCGNKKIPGFINIDVMKTLATDLICDFTNIKPYFKDNSIDYIYACHVFEHLSRHVYLRTLSDLYDILKPGALLRVSVPDFEALVGYYIKTKDLKEIRGTLYGGQKNEFDYHKWAWDFKHLTEDLFSVGFIDIKRYNPKDTEHAVIRDWALDFLPRHDAFGKELPDEVWYKGILVSLNVQATKPENK